MKLTKEDIALLVTYTKWLKRNKRNLTFAFYPETTVIDLFVNDAKNGEPLEQEINNGEHLRDF